MSGKKKKQRDKKRGEHKENIDVKNKKEEGNIILMGAPRKDTKELPLKTKIETKVESAKKEKEKPKDKLSEIAQNVRGATVKNKDHANLGKIFLILFALFVVYLIFGQLSNNFGPTTISFISLWPLLLILVGLSLFRVKKNSYRHIVAIILVIVVFFAASVSILKKGNVVAIHTADIEVTEERGLDPFSVVVFDGIGTLEVREGDRDMVIVTADESIIEEMKTVVIGDTLQISYKNTLWSLFLFEKTSVDVVVISTDISSVRLTGKGDSIIKDIRGDSLNISIDGEGNVTATNIQVEDFVVQINGKGDVIASGSSTEELVIITGSGSYYGEDLVSLETGVSINGKGNAYVNTEDKLSASIKGVGNIVYTGSPELNISVKDEEFIMSKDESETKEEEEEEEGVTEDSVLDNVNEEEGKDDRIIVEDPEAFLKSMNSILEE